MSRDGSGTYTLPSGNPVVTGTVISSSVHNATMTDLETEMTNSTDKDGQTVITGTWDFNANKIILDLDGDTSVTADTDDQVDWEIGGTDLIKWVDGIYQYSDTDAGSAIGPILKIYRNSASPADADFIGALYFDGEDSAGNQDTFASLETQIDDVTSTTEDGTLLIKTMAAGTLTTQFDISSAGITITPSVTMTGDSTALTYTATGDSSAGDNATLAYTSAEGAILTGQGSTSDITLKNDADATIMDVATGTLIAAFKGGVTIADDLTMAEGALAITDTANEIALTVTSSATTASSVKFASASQTSGRVIQATDIDALTTGSISYFISNSSNTGTRTISHFENQHASAVNATVVEVKQCAAERALFVNQDANGIGLEIDSEATSQAIIRLTAPTITTGNCIQVTDANALTTGTLANLQSNSSDTGTRTLVNIVNDHVDATGVTALSLRQDSTGDGIFLDHNQNGIALKIESDATTANSFRIDSNSLTTGAAASIVSNSSSTASGNVLFVQQDNSLATGRTSLRVLQNSATDCLFIDQDANGIGINIDHEGSSQNAVNIVSEVTTGHGIQVTADSLTTGYCGYFYSNSSETNPRNVVRIWNDNASATGTSSLSVRQDSTGDGITVDQDGNGIAIDIDSEATSAVGIRIDNASSTGASLSMLKGTTDAAFLDFIATADGDSTSAISTLTTSGATTHHVQVDINGAKAWIAVSTNPPS